MATTKTFTAIVERDPESGWLIGEVTELPGCYTQAPDLPALEINLREAIAVYLQTAGKSSGSKRIQMGSPRGKSQHIPRQIRKNHRDSRSRFDGDLSPIVA